MKTDEVPLSEITERGCQALIRELGISGMARFLRQFRHGDIDYTRDRHLWLDKLDLDEEWAAIMQLQEEAKVKARTTKRRQRPVKSARSAQPVKPARSAKAARVAKSA